MKKLIYAKGFILGVVFSLIIATLIIPGIASNGSREATLSYRDIKITLDGEEIVPTDVEGNPVEPFIIDGTTYLPVRGISSALNLGVDWDGETSTVLLTTEGYEGPVVSADYGSLEIFEATLTEFVGTPRLTIHCANTLSRDITGFDVEVHCYVEGGKVPVNSGSSNIFRGRVTSPVRGWESASEYVVDIIAFGGTTYVDFAVTGYAAADGTIIEIPETERVWFDATLGDDPPDYPDDDPYGDDPYEY